MNGRAEAVTYEQNSVFSGEEKHTIGSS